jgi:hypothetical protein
LRAYPQPQRGTAEKPSRNRPIIKTHIPHQPIQSKTTKADRDDIPEGGVSDAFRGIEGPLRIPSRLLMGPGPSNAYPRVLAAQALPLLGHMHPAFFEARAACVVLCCVVLCCVVLCCVVLWCVVVWCLAGKVIDAFGGRGECLRFNTLIIHHRLCKHCNSPLHDNNIHIQIMDEIQKGLKYLFQTESPYTCLISGTGHAGMEAVVANLLEPGDKVVVGVSGIWGERVCDMAERFQGMRALGEAVVFRCVCVLRRTSAAPCLHS